MFLLSYFVLFSDTEDYLLFKEISVNEKKKKVKET